MANVSTEMLIFDERTGLPPSAEDDELSDNSDSEEEDEADEDSNGLCSDVSRDVALTLIYELSQPKSTTRTTIPMTKILIPMMVVYHT